MFAVAGVVRDAGAVWAGGVTFRSESEDAAFSNDAPHLRYRWWKIESLLLSRLPPPGGRERPLPALYNNIIMGVPISGVRAAAARIPIDVGVCVAALHQWTS